MEEGRKNRDTASSSVGHDLFDAARKCSVRIAEYVSRGSGEAATRAAALQQNFELWAKHSGVRSREGLSLDDRLKHHTELKVSFLGLLRLIDEKLQEDTEPPDEDSPRQPSDTSALGSLDGLDADELLIVSRWMSYSGSSREVIGAAIDLLIELSSIIRKSASSKRHSRMSTNFLHSDDAYFARYARVLVRNQHNYPSARKSLTDQLGESIYERRRHLLYEMRHEEKLSQPRPNSTSPRLAKPESSSTASAARYAPDGKASRQSRADRHLSPAGYQPPPSANPVPLSTNFSGINSNIPSRSPHKHSPLSGKSVGSKSRGMAKLEYPKPPAYDEKSPYCVCPLCSNMLPRSVVLSTEWGDHLDMHMEPYVCISEKCRGVLLFFASESKWLGHMEKFHGQDWPQTVHMRTWYCDMEHTKMEFFHEQQFRGHIAGMHSELSDSHVDVLARRNWGYGRRDAAICPLCETEPKDIKPSLNDKAKTSILLRHIGDELKSLALYSLPWRDDCPLEDGEPSSASPQISNTIGQSQAAPPKSGGSLVHSEASDQRRLVFDDVPPHLRPDQGHSPDGTLEPDNTAASIAIDWKSYRVNDNKDVGDESAIENMKAFREKDKLLRRRFERTGSMDDLNRAVEVADMAVDATPQDYPDRASRLNNLGTQLGRRFEWTGSMDDLDRAVDVVEMAVDTTPQDHPDRAGILSNLGALLGRRFERTGSMDDLNRAVEVADMAVDATPQDYPDRASRLNNLGTQLGRRFERTGSMDDLNRAVEVADMAVDATPQDYPDRASRLNNLGTQLGRRFEWTGSMDDLNHAVEVIEMAVDTTPQDHPDRASRLNNLGTQLGRRFERTGSMDDLNRAVEVADMAVDATPQDYPDRASRLNNLGTQLGRRFEWTGSMDDLNHAVEVIEMAVDTTPQDYPGWASRLNNLGTQLGRRFERTGSMDDLNRAVEVADMAVDATPQDYPDRASRLNNLGTQLGRRFEWTGSMDDLDRAVDVVEMAVDTTPQDHPDRAGILSNLGALLGRRFERTGSMDDLNRAVEVADMAVDATPQDYPDRASRLNNLGTQLGRRFERTGSMDDLDRAVDVVEMAVDATPQDHPDRAGRLNNLGNWLGMRFGRTGSMDDLNRRLSSYKEGWSCRAAPPSVRIGLARSAARILADQLNWRESSQLLQDAVELLPTVSPRSLQHMLADFAGLASMAAATALNTGRDAYHALQLLELGRGVIAGLLMEMRGDISDLKQQHPSLADEFTSLRDELDAPADRTTSLVSTADTPSVESQARRRREADQKFSELITRIRAQPGFHNFLLPPTADELMAAADPDPIVVVNVSRYRCDAFLVERHHIRALNLPNLSPGGVEISREFLRILDPSLGRPIVLEVLLEWLWEVAACPILEALGYKQSSPDNWPHIWWIPAGLLSQLPLHAAGRHLKGSGETVLDRVMSSYSSSIKALIYGRQHRGRRVREPPDVVSENGNGLLVALPETVGYANLPYAGQEVDLLEGLCTSLHLNPIKPELRREDILKHLPACEVFHFAGHGLSHPSEPSRSGLLLKDGMTSLLTVADLRDIKLQESSPFLAYLSACSTSAINAGKLVDEGIHLVNACQLAGFRHVVGTLWEVSDPHCVDMARVLYETLKEEGMTDTAVYRGVHQAIRTLRDRAVESRVSGTTTRTETVDDTDDLIQSMKATIFSNTAETNDPRRSTPEMESWRTLMRGCIEGTDTGDSEAKVRNAKALKKKLAASDLRLPDVFWVPYVHFGV